MEARHGSRQLRRVRQCVALVAVLTFVPSALAYAGNSGPLSVTITKPGTGAVIARGTAATLHVAGRARFEAPAKSSRVYYAGAHYYPGRLTLRPNHEPVGGQEVASVTPLNEVSADRTPSEYRTYALDRRPFTLDTSRPLSGVVTHRSYSAVPGESVHVGAGLTTIDVTVRAEKIGGGSATLGSATVSYAALPTHADHQVPWSVRIPRALERKDFTGNVTMTLVVRGYNVLHGWTVPDATKFTVPIYTASFARKVQVSLDHGAFTGSRVKLSGDRSRWAATIPMPQGGRHTLRARAVQGWRTDTSGFTVPRTSPVFTRTFTVGRP